VADQRPEPPTLNRGLSPQQELVERSRGLVKILIVRADTFAGKEAAAYHIMSHLLAMPTIREQSRRHSYGNEILGNASLLFPPDGSGYNPFIKAIDTVVIEMQEFPFWFSHITMSNEKLGSEYHLVTAILGGMSWVGMGPIAVVPAGAKAAMVAAQKAVPRTASSMLMQGAKGFASGATKSVTGGLGGRLAVVWIIGVAAATAMKDRQTMLKREIDRRFSEGLLSAELYRRAIGDDATLPYVYFSKVR